MFKRTIFSILSLLLLSAGCVDNTPSTPSENIRPDINLIVADPLTVKPGGQSTITVQASDANDDPLKFSYEATLGEIEPMGASAIFTAGDKEGRAWVTVTVDDQKGETRQGSVSVNIMQEQPLLTIGVLMLDAASSTEQCLAFFALAAEDVAVQNVTIENPMGQSFLVNGGVVLAGQTLALQLPGRCYTKHVGTYTFTFNLQRPGGDFFQFVATYQQL
ncbi:MAG: hypothetical protein D6743_19035 [Calditrichaeota bacterium]|nr:MAG: hypothetical protein D6743_19035 [Calditrichota bacterium]